MTLEQGIQDLDGHGSLQTQLGGPIDVSGSAFTDFLLDLIAGDFPGVLGCFHFDHRDLLRSLGLGRQLSIMRSDVCGVQP